MFLEEKPSLWRSPKGGKKWAVTQLHCSVLSSSYDGWRSRASSCTGLTLQIILTKPNRLPSTGWILLAFVFKCSQLHSPWVPAQSHFPKRCVLVWHSNTRAWRLCSSLSCPCLHLDDTWLQVGGHQGALVAPGLDETVRGIPKGRVFSRQDEAAWGRKGAALQLCFTSPSQGTPLEHPGMQAKASGFGLMPADAGKTAPGVNKEENWSEIHPVAHFHLLLEANLRFGGEPILGGCCELAQWDAGRTSEELWLLSWCWTCVPLLPLPQHLDRYFFTMKWGLGLAGCLGKVGCSIPKTLLWGGYVVANTAFRWSITKCSIQSPALGELVLLILLL